MIKISGERRHAYTSAFMSATTPLGDLDLRLSPTAVSSTLKGDIERDREGDRESEKEIDGKIEIERDGETEEGERRGERERDGWEKEGEREETLIILDDTAYKAKRGDKHSSMESSVQNFEVSESQQDETTPKLRSILYKIGKTLCIVLVWLCIGLWSEVNGATLQDLMYITHSNYEIISRAISMRGTGNLAGALLGGGFIVDKFHSKVELIVAICLVGCAALNAAIPYCQYIELLFAIYVVEGWLELIVNIGGQVIIMDIWLSKASGPLHLIHLGYGAGSFIVPQIVSNFISESLPERESAVSNPKCLDSITSVNQSYNESESLNFTTTAVIGQPSEIVQYGFLIISGVIIVVSVIWFLYFFLDKTDSTLPKVLQQPSIKEIFNLNTCLPGHPVYVFAIYLLMFCWTYIAVVGERVFAKYLYSYAREQSCFNKEDATLILTAFWIAFTAGRFLGFVVAFLIPMKIIIFIEGFGNLASAMVLYFFSDNVTVLWTCVCISGILIGPCYPSGLAWANRYALITATGVTVLSVAAGVSDLSFLFTIGYFVETYGIKVMTTFVLAYGAIVAALPILMQGIACIRGDRFENANSKKEDD
ncbi:sodium-dependent glucose transporter 1B-like [Watersipora subatra]|uniref:sodium-dependent glucose transporter 1B-like n=1 Tax=Watersipora subatra TaxID=2589382 RepID=UPI00355B1332